MMKKKGQATLEAVILIIICVVAWLAMQGYLKRAVQGNWKSNADLFSDEQYDENKTIEKSHNYGVTLNTQQPPIVFKGTKLSDDVSGDDNLLDEQGLIKVKNWGAAW